jgi:hypothetical protein
MDSKTLEIESVEETSENATTLPIIINQTIPLFDEIVIEYNSRPKFFRFKKNLSLFDWSIYHIDNSKPLNLSKLEKYFRGWMESVMRKNYETEATTLANRIGELWEKEYEIKIFYCRIARGSPFRIYKLENKP